MTLGNPLVDNQFSANGENVVQVTGGTLADPDETWTPQGDLNTYRVVSDDIIVPADRTWTLAPGVNVQFDFGRGAQDRRHAGRRRQPRRSRSASPAPGASPRPCPAIGKGSAFSAGSAGSLRYASVEFAANGITQDGGELNVISSTIAASREDGILARGGSLTLAGNALADNGEFAIDNRSDHTIDASGSWWGSATGPYAPDDNPSGAGDAVSGDVDVQGLAH